MRIELYILISVVVFFAVHTVMVKYIPVKKHPKIFLWAVLGYWGITAGAIMGGLFTL